MSKCHIVGNHMSRLILSINKLSPPKYIFTLVFLKDHIGLGKRKPDFVASAQADQHVCFSLSGMYYDST